MVSDTRPAGDDAQVQPDNKVKLFPLWSEQLASWGELLNAQYREVKEAIERIRVVLEPMNRRLTILQNAQVKIDDARQLGDGGARLGAPGAGGQRG